MNAAQIAAGLGAAHRSGDWYRCRCPVHGSRGPTLALRAGDRGRLIAVCHAGCAPGDILDELRRRGLLCDRDRYQPIPTPILRADENAAGRLKIALRIWTETREARGTPAEAYLAGRGITITPPASLRYAPALRRPDGICGPAMVARIDNVSGGVIGVHRTWISRDAGVWRRTQRQMLGRAAGVVATDQGNWRDCQHARFSH